MSRNREFNSDPFQTAGVEQGEDNSAYDDMMSAIAPGAPLTPFKGRRGRVPDNALELLGDGTIKFKNATITQTGLALDGDLSSDDWEALGGVLIHMEGSVGWNIGDWCEYARDAWDASYEEIAGKFDYPVETLWVYASVCRSYPTLIRNQGVSMSHHRLVAARPDREMLLERAAREGWTLKQLREAIKPEREEPVESKLVRRTKSFKSGIAKQIKTMGAEDRQKVRQMLTELLEML